MVGNITVGNDGRSGEEISKALEEGSNTLDENLTKFRETMEKLTKDNKRPVSLQKGVEEERSISIDEFIDFKCRFEFDSHTEDGFEKSVFFNKVRALPEEKYSGFMVNIVDGNKLINPIFSSILNYDKSLFKKGSIKKVAMYKSLEEIEKFIEETSDENNRKIYIVKFDLIYHICIKKNQFN